ncbi:MAG: hypothetical protein QXV64_00175 [Candidatus Anstonellaceae archaeon]
MIKIQKLFFVMAVLFGFLFAQSAQETFLIVNSEDWKDVLSSAVYAAQNNYKHVFILTPEQGDYIFSLISGTSTPFYYFESEKPVNPNLFEKFSLLDSSRVFKKTNLANFFASQSKNPGAIVVDSQIGAEAISVSPYAVFKGWGIYFSNPQQLTSLLDTLKSEGKEILVYGQIASVVPQNFVVKKINTGSIYLDNLELLKLFEKEKDIIQVVFTSGKTFEESIAKTDPVVLVGRTEITKELADWLISKPKLKGIIFDGDSDISGALQSIKKESGISIFTKLGTGYSTDAKVKPNLVLVLPSKNVILDINTPIYDYSTSSLKVEVKNKGNSKAYVQLAAELPNGNFISSPKKEIEPLASHKFELFLNSAGLSNPINKVTLHVFSSAEPKIIEAIDIVEFLNVKMENLQPRQESKEIQQNSLSGSSTTPTQSPYSDYIANINVLFSILVIIIVIILYLYGKNKITGRLNHQEGGFEPETKKEQKDKKKKKRAGKK